MRIFFLGWSSGSEEVVRYAACEMAAFSSAARAAIARVVVASSSSFFLIADEVLSEGAVDFEAIKSNLSGLHS